MILLNNECCEVCKNSLGMTVQYITYYYCSPCSKKLCTECVQEKEGKCPFCSKILRKHSNQNRPGLMH
jgi:hypothetical protein